MELGKMRLILSGFEDGLKAYPKTAGCDRAASPTGQGNHHQATPL